MAADAPILVWIRRDLRLADHPALAQAAGSGRPVIPVFIHDNEVAALGAAPRWRLGQGLAAFSAALERIGARPVLRRGEALPLLRALVAETGAGDVWWQRAYAPGEIARDKAVKAALRADGTGARSFPGHLLQEPLDVSPKAGGYFKVFTPFWRALQARDMAPLVPPVMQLRPPRAWPGGDVLEHWQMGRGMARAGKVLRRHVQPGEAAAQVRLARFFDERLDRYAELRDFPGASATSELSDHLALGEISPRTLWVRAMRAMQDGQGGAEPFLRQLAWRDFAWHLLYHTPHLESANWRRDWDGFAWDARGDRPEVQAWKQGRTGIALVDAGMREMHVTGRMHNRARMIAASYLTKHLLADWRIGQRWFAEHLVDWDPASNALGWQWVAGSGPDAAPYFRIFNPETQAAKFDAQGRYRHRWIAEGQDAPPATALDFFDAVPRRWGLSPDDRYPVPVVGLAEGRQRALDAYAAHRALGAAGQS